MSGNGNQVPLAPPTQRGPGTYPRAPTPHRAECYHPSGTGAAAYLPPGTPGAGQGNAQAAMRVPSAQQQPPPQQQQQDLSKATMQQHNFVAGQGQGQPRAQFTNYPYRPTQHGARTPTHPRQQQPQYIPGGAASGAAPVMYPALVFQPTPINISQSFQPPRSQGYYPYMTSIYSAPGHTPSYYFQSGAQPMHPPNIAANGHGRNNTSNLVGPQGSPAAPTAPASSLPYPGQPSPHIHQTMPGVRPTQQKRSHRLQIIDPVTRQDILSSELFADSTNASGENSERQTPQPEVPTPSASVEFTRMVLEAVNSTSDTKKMNSKPIEPTRPTISSPIPVHINVPSGVATSNMLKSDVIENKNTTQDTTDRPSETPVVSAISNSPVIVPKLPINIKQNLKPSEYIAPNPVDVANKNANVKQHKPSVSKPPVGQIDEMEVSERGAVPAAQAPAAAPPAPSAAPAPSSAKLDAAPPLPQRVAHDRARSELKEKGLDVNQPSYRPNGPTHQPIVSYKPELVKNPTSQTSPEVINTCKSAQVDNKVTVSCENRSDSAIIPNLDLQGNIALNPTELLSAGIEKSAKDIELDSKETTKAIEAQTKLTQSLASCLRSDNTECKMKDINLNKTTDPDSANGNTPTATDNNANKNEKSAKNNKNQNKKSINKKVSPSLEKLDNKEALHENGKVETDKIREVEQVNSTPTEEETANMAPAAETVELAPTPPPPAYVPQYKYTDDQWSPLNKTGKKSYDLSLLKQIKDHPMSKTKPDAPLLEALKVVREPQVFAPIIRPANDSLFPPFVKAGMSRSTSRDPKKDGRPGMPPPGNGSLKLTPSVGGSSSYKPVIHVSIRENVKLNQTENAWKPARLKKGNATDEELEQELYKKFRGILNKLTPQKFDTLMEKVKQLQITNQKCLEGVITLVFEKAIEEPNFSEAYATMCEKLSKIMVPADNATSPEQYVNFKVLIISKCQSQFVTNKTDDNVLKLEKEMAECTDPVKKKELHLMLEEENRRVRMRSVGNVRFIGELYKLKMLTSRVMVICMNHLIEHLDEEKLECLCKLITTIGQQVEGEAKEQLDAVFKKMQDIVDRKSNKISSRVRFMIQDVIELRGRKWVTKNVVDLQPKMMDQIQKEADQQQRHIEFMNSVPMGGFRRDDGGRGKRGGDGRRTTGGVGGGGGGGSGNNFVFADNNWKYNKNYSVDTSKLKAAANKNLSNIKLAPHMGWNCGAGANKNTAQAASNSLLSLPTSNNMYSVLADNIQTDPTTLRGNKDTSSSFHSKGASIERSTFNTRDLGGSNRGSSESSRQQAAGLRSAVAAQGALAEVPAAPAAAQVPLTAQQEQSVRSMVSLYLFNDESTVLTESVADIQEMFTPQQHAAVVTEILNSIFEKSAKDILMISKILVHLTSTNTISAENFLAGLHKITEIAPDLYIDIPMLDGCLAKICGPQIEKKHVSFADILKISDKIISENHGHLFLKALIENIKESMGPSFVKSKWQESGVSIKDWMKEDQVAKFVQDNNFDFLEGAPVKASEEITKILNPVEARTKLLQLMNSDETCECIRGWVQDNLGKFSNEDWFMRALIQAICEHALFGPGGREVPHFKQDRMNKYCGLINEFGNSKPAREASCLFGIQQLIHRLEHPQGLTLEIFQYLHEQYIISVEGFLEWETSEKEPEGKAVMLKALTSFFTNIKEAENEDSCSED